MPMFQRGDGVRAVYHPEEVENGDLVVRIIELVANVQNTQAETLPPLQTSIDGEALESLLRSTAPGGEIHVMFSYAGTTVSITHTNQISIRVTEM